MMSLSGVLLSCILLLAPVALAAEAAPAPKSGTVSARLRGNQIGYTYTLCQPPERIQGDSQAPLSFATPKAALISMFQLMSQGRVEEWKKLWLLSGPSQSKFSDDDFKAGWKEWLQKPHFVLFVLEYEGHTIFVTEQEGGGPGSRAKFFFKKKDDRYFLTRDLFETDLAEIVDSPNFDVRTGVLEVGALALYSFENLEPRVAVIDTATTALLGMDHTANLGSGKGLKQVPGVKGEGVFFDGDSFVELPMSIPLALNKNAFKIALFARPEFAPATDANKVGAEQAYTLVSRGKPGDEEGRILLQIRMGADRKPCVWLEVGSGAALVSCRSESFEIDPARWLKIGCSYAAGTLNLTLDGKTCSASSTDAQGLQVCSGGARFVVGKDQGASALSYRGALDELAIFDEVEP